MRNNGGYRFESCGGVDALGRILPSRKEVGPPRKDRYVGLFYFLWLGQHGTEGPHDNTRIAAESPEAVRDSGHPAWGPAEAYHFWGEPLYGYYLNDDEWVLRKHVQLLTAAGVDFLVFDTTNAVTYKNVYDRLFRILDEIGSQGFDVPRFAFYTNTESGRTVAEIYEDVYKAGRYRHLWFHWKGKPLIIGDPDQCAEEHRSFFTFRLNQWPNEAAKTNGFPWIEFQRPQRVFYNDEGEKETISVSVAQHPSVAMSDTPFYGYGDNWGRGFQANASHEEACSEEAIARGANVEEQWAFALAEDPSVVFVTGWNEWIAMRLRGPAERPVLFVDQATLNFSRDIEPMKGGYGDNYYMQLIANIRRFKGLPDDTAASFRLPKAIPIGPDFAPWAAVSAEYADFRGKTRPRNHPGYGGLHYANDTGRNELVAFKTAHSDDKVYFYAGTAADLVPGQGDDPWMMLLIRVEGREDTGWEGFHYVVNRRTGNGAAMLERSLGGWRWEPVAEVRQAAKGNELHLEIPRACLGLSKAARERRLAFKWADHMKNEGDAMDFYQFGDVAPIGRLHYVYSIPAGE
ncbi:hypothetical protein ACF3MZ_16585 [Paenibacillaceae bacterium WGS1546]|uniref:hypothetical protein n=1 Tax=Cohnella sp. WGS1546 TaxID=3366810 RepID=UPI00372D5C7D